MEYPWEAGDAGGEQTWHPPVHHRWALAETLRSGTGAQVLQFIETLLERFDAVFR